MMTDCVFSTAYCEEDAYQYQPEVTALPSMLSPASDYVLHADPIYLWKFVVRFCGTGLFNGPSLLSLPLIDIAHAVRFCGTGGLFLLPDYHRALGKAQVSSTYPASDSN